MAKAFASQADLEQKQITFTQLSENAWAYTAEGDPNSGVIVGDDGVLIVDTTATPAMAQDLIAKIRTITDKPGSHSYSGAAKRSVFSRNPALRLATGALRLGGGIALTAATGGVAPAIIATTMIVSGGASTLSGAGGTLLGAFNRFAKRTARKEASASINLKFNPPKNPGGPAAG